MAESSKSKLVLILILTPVIPLSAQNVTSCTGKNMYVRTSYVTRRNLNLGGRPLVFGSLSVRLATGDYEKNLMCCGCELWSLFLRPTVELELLFFTNEWRLHQREVDKHHRAARNGQNLALRRFLWGSLFTSYNEWMVNRDGFSNDMTRSHFFLYMTFITYFKTELVVSVYVSIFPENNLYGDWRFWNRLVTVHKTTTEPRVLTMNTLRNSINI